MITEDSSDSEEKRSLDQLKKTFLDKAKAAGFDTGRFKENKLSYALVQYGSYGTNGTTYSVETASSEEIMALNQLIDNKSGSVSIIARRVTYLPVKDFSRIIAAALTNGKERAEKVAALMGEKLGILQTVIDYSVTNEEVEDTDHYRPDEDKYYILSLKYLIE
nr:hypothetical protein [Elizabethkingia sp. YR214]